MAGGSSCRDIGPYTTVPSSSRVTWSTSAASRVGQFSPIHDSASPWVEYAEVSPSIATTGSTCAPVEFSYLHVNAMEQYLRRSTMPSPILPRRSFVLGGARSGKSAFSESLLAQAGSVVYAATAPRYPNDAEWSERIARHRADRPERWRTVEVAAHPDLLGELLRTSREPVLVDCLTLWLTAAMDAAEAWDDAAWDSGAAGELLDGWVTGLADGFARSTARIVVVSNEIGFGIVPQSAGTRRFRDELGRLNQRFAAIADEVVLVVAGLPVQVK